MLSWSPRQIQRFRIRRIQDSNQSTGVKQLHAKVSQLSRETSIRYAGWQVVLACFVMATLSWGIGFYGHGIYLVELQRIHHWSVSAISDATTSYYLFSAVLIAFLNKPLTALGARGFLMLGTVMLIAPVTMLSVITAPWQLYAIYFVMAFGWAATSLVGITIVIGPWFEARRALAISLALNGASVAGIVVVPVQTFAISSFGFGAATFWGAIIALALLLPLLFVLVSDPPNAGVTEAALPAEKSVCGESTRWSALTSFRFWTIAGPYALAITAQVGFLFHLIAIAEPSLGNSGAALALATVAAFGFVGRMALGIVLDRLEPRVVSACAVASQAAALLLLLWASDDRATFVCCALFGLSIGNTLILPIAIIQREYDFASFGMLVALATAIAQFAFSLGPAVLGTLRDATGSYVLPIVVCIGLQVAAAIMVLAGRRQLRGKRQ